MVAGGECGSEVSVLSPNITNGGYLHYRVNQKDTKDCGNDAQRSFADGD